MADLETSARLVLRALATQPIGELLNGEEIAGATGLVPDVVSLAVERCESRGWVKTIGKHGFGSFSFGAVASTALGRVVVREYTPEGSEGKRNEPKPADNGKVSETQPIRVFISHSSVDFEITRRFVDLITVALRLPAAAIRCTSLSGLKLPGGVHTESQLRTEISTADAFVGILSPASLGSTYVLFELGARWVLERRWFPLLVPWLAEDALKEPLRGRNALRLDDDADVHQVVAELGQVLEVDPQSPHIYQFALTQLRSCRQASPGEDISKLTKIVPVRSGLSAAELAPEILIVLTALSHSTDALNISQVVSMTDLPPQRALYFCDEASAEGLLEVLPAPAGRVYSLTARGRRLLFESKLI